MRRDYAVFDDWYIEGEINEVAEIIYNAPGYAEWWPATFLNVSVVERGDERLVGEVYEVLIKGRLPYTVRFRLRVTETDFPRFARMKVSGNVEGESVWAIEQHGPVVQVRFTWNVKFAVPVLRHLPFLVHPVISANHRWAMRRGEESIRLELARRRAKSVEALARIPPSPGPTWRVQWPWRRTPATGNHRPEPDEQSGSPHR